MAVDARYSTKTGEVQCPNCGELAPYELAGAARYQASVFRCEACDFAAHLRLEVTGRKLKAPAREPAPEALEGDDELLEGDDQVLEG